MTTTRSRSPFVGSAATITATITAHSASVKRETPGRGVGRGPFAAGRSARAGVEPA